MTENPQKKIRVLYTYANTFELGGADFCLLKLAAGLNPEQFEVYVVLSQKCALEDKYWNANIQLHYINMPRLKVTKNPFKLLGYFVYGIFSIFRLDRFIKKNQIDIVHANDLLDFYGPIAAKISKIKSIQHVRMILPDGILKRVLTQLTLMLNDKVVAVSKGTALAMFTGKNTSKKVVVGYDWYDPVITGHQVLGIPFRKENGFLESDLLIGIVGRLQDWKGQHIFLRAGEKLCNKHSNIKLIICGGEVHGRHLTYAVDLKRIVDEMNINENVLFTGYRSDVINIIMSFDILVHASITPDPLPGVIMEAGLCKVPVVAANAGGVPEEVVDGESGFLFNPGDTDDLFAKIDGLIELGEEGRKIMGGHGEAFIRKTFAPNKIIEQFEALYHNVNEE